MVVFRGEGEFVTIVDRELTGLEDRFTSDAYPMRSGHDRVASFQHGTWKGLPDQIYALAESGFYVKPVGAKKMKRAYDDEVTCAFCDVCIAKWDPKDDPIEEHKKASKYCPMVLGKIVGNVPIVRDPFLAHCNLVSFVVDLLIRTIESRNPELKGTFVRITPVHESYRTVMSRLKTFVALWPKEAIAPAQVLADAGFFYPGTRDYVQCFQCGLGLGGWIKGAKAMALHAHYSPKCSYVRLSRPPPSPPILSMEDTRLVHNGCQICLGDEIFGVFLPCGHAFSCWKCALCTSNCPVCRRLITCDVPMFRV
jgi:baculoviral IAP repeat-containing protein 7/8